MMDRIRVLARWLRIPFSDRVLLAALIAAAAIPAFLVAAAGHWERAAADEFTARLLEGSTPEDLGVAITVEALFAGGATVAAADDVVREALQDPRLGAPVRTMTTAQALALTGPDLGPAGVPVRLLARPGALDELEVVAGTPGATGGVWISEWFAEDSELGVGDVLVFESSLEPEDPGAEGMLGGGPTTDLDIVGVYRTLWTVDSEPPPEYWSDVPPPGIVPTFIRPFGEPGFSLLITDEATLASSGVTGAVRWDAPLLEMPAGLTAVSTIDNRYTAAERTLTTDPTAVAALGELAPTVALVAVDSLLRDIRREADAAAATLGQPIESARAAGIFIGLGVMLSAGLLLVQRRRIEYRLLAGEGDRWLRTAVRTVAQLATPVLIGTAVGVGVAMPVASAVFPDAVIAAGNVDGAVVVMVALGGLALAGVASGLAGQATLDTGRLAPVRVVLWPAAVAIVASAFLWFQVGRTRTTGPGAIDYALVSLPIIVLVAAVLVLVALLDLVRRRIRRRSTRPKRAVLFLAIRRTMAESVGGRLTVAALGIGVGVFVFAGVLTATLARSVEVKSAVQVGGAASLELLSHPPATTSLPQGSTLLAVQTTTIQPGDVRVQVVAIDPATFADGVDWQDEYGLEVGELLDLLGREVNSGVAVVAVTGDAVPTVGAFGTFQSFPYEVVGRADAVPFASSTGATLVVSTREIDRLELGRLGLTPDTPGVDRLFQSPVRRFRPYLVTSGTAEDLEEFLRTNDLIVRSTTTRDDVANSVEAIAARVAFDYLRLLGAVGALASLAAIGLFTSMRRRATALSAALTRRMGLDKSRAALVGLVEIGLLAVLASLAGGLAVPVVVTRVLPRFDPVAALPPDLGIVIPAGVMIWSAVLLGGVAVFVWLVERIGANRPAAEVFRDIG